jgi:4-(gamma-glutamylamino)butanal dehydrogenase
VGPTAVDAPQAGPAIVRAQTYLSSIDWSSPERLVERMVLDPVAAIDWRQLAADTTISDGMFIGGERRAAIDGSTRPVHAARDGSRLVDLAWAQAADADAAVAAARAAFDHGPWPRLHPRARGEILQHFADLIEEHRREIALLISLEMGKPIRDAYQIELRALIRCLRFYGELADKESGEITPTEEGELSLVTREPAGVVAAVVPWNFPLTLGGWKLAPALAAGCTVVLKTAEQSPLSMQRVAEVGAMAGLPPGVFNVISGDGRWSAAIWENTPMSTSSPLPGQLRSGVIS